MNQSPLEQRLRDAISRRPLSAGEMAELDAWLATHPETRADWELELALSKSLARQPDATVPSNFTARVLQEIEREETISRRGRAKVWGGWWRALVPRLAVGGVAVVALAVFVHQRNEADQQRELVQNLSTVAAVRSLPSVEMLQDFDAIRSLNVAAKADEDILALQDELRSLKQ